MGYKVQRTIVNILFDEDSDLYGLEVRTTAPPLGEFLELTKLAGIDFKKLKPEDADKLEGPFRLFARNLISWNLEDDKGPVPATYDGIKSQDIQLIFKLIDAWMTSVAGISVPKEQSLNGGQQFPTVSIPMEPLSPSQSS